ncbi:MAG TPA: DnaJ C-terminal domain-containing protein [Solirubrobacteraceae bacterium]|jgi:curved DNA-binding protein|nr:DnaJ C-terminal domain-containing protein [Solirubrobacteraceae bacterium]
MAVGFQDYYEALEVPRTASQEEIRRAYRKLARKYHPDVNKEAGAEDRFKEISEAYEVLRDEDKRARYDQLGANWKAGQDVSGAGGFGEAFRPGDGFGDVRVDFGNGDFSDFFEGLFGARGPRGGARATPGGAGFDGFSLRGVDQEAVLELTLEEAAAGGKRRLSLGDGRDFEVDIPRGVRDGQRIRLAGQGSQGAGGGPSGDLYLRVRIKPHPRFRLEGRDIYVDLPVSPWEAALGAEVPVATLSGSVTLKVPEGSSTGRRLRLRGQGLPGQDGSAGDLYAVLAVHVPKTLTKQERELFEKLADASKFDPRKGR